MAWYDIVMNGLGGVPPSGPPTPPFRPPTDAAGPAPPGAPEFGAQNRLDVAHMANVNPPFQLPPAGDLSAMPVVPMQQPIPPNLRDDFYAPERNPTLDQPKKPKERKTPRKRRAVP